MSESSVSPLRRLRRPLKRILGWFLFETGLYRAAISDDAVVVAFHRVNDTESPGLSCTMSEFVGYCRFFQRFFNVTTLRDIADRLRRSGSFERHLAITFDDGYQDNYLNAAPILTRMKLPATFFVTTGFVESRRVPWWDERAGETHPWMTWHQILALSADGFDIGAHSETHSDLVRLPVAAARREIHGSKRELEDRLKRPVDLFAYPYGGREHITDELLDVVKEEAFFCCCSCYGGVNSPATDPYRINRIAIDAIYGSPYEFGFNLVAGRA